MTDVLEQTPPEPARRARRPAPGTPDDESPGWIDKVAGRLSSVSIEGWITFVIVVGSVVFTLAQLHPNLLFRTPLPPAATWGRTCWGPAYLRDHILPHWRLTGWAPDWYAGFPMYRLLHGVPGAGRGALNILLPYGVALKLVAILGVLIAADRAWAFGKLRGLRFPLPALFSVAVGDLPLRRELHDLRRQHRIDDGGRVLVLDRACRSRSSTSACFARGLRTGKHRALAAVLFALCAALPRHRDVLRGDRHRRAGSCSRSTGAASSGSRRSVPSARCSLRLLGRAVLLRRHVRHRHGVRAAHRLREHAVPVHVEHGTPHIFAARRRSACIVSIMSGAAPACGSVVMTLIYGVWVIVWPQSMLWNTRLLPFIYICRYLLAGDRRSSRSGSGWPRHARAPAPRGLEAVRRLRSHRVIGVGDLHRDPRHEPAHAPGRPHRPEADLLGQRRRRTAGSVLTSTTPRSSTTGPSGTTRGTRASPRTASTAASWRRCRTSARQRRMRPGDVGEQHASSTSTAHRWR